MRFFEYLYYRMYSAYRAKDDSPLLRTVSYLSIWHFILLLLVALYARKLFPQTPELPHGAAGKLVGGIMVASVVIYVYFSYGKQPFERYEQLFENRARLNANVKVWMLIVLPFVVLVAGICLMILLFGGKMFGQPFSGWLS